MLVSDGKEVLYRPSKWGAEFHALPHNEALGAGAVGPGKSFVLLMEPLAQIYVEQERQNNPDHPYPKRRGESLGWALHLRRESTTLDQTIARFKRIYPVVDPGMKWYESDLKGVFSSGYIYQFGHCKDPDDWLKFNSNEFSIICYDELVEFNQEQYEMINTRLRSSDPVLRKMLKIRAMSNPEIRKPRGATWNVDNPNWVRDYFVAPAREGRVTLERKLTLHSGEKVTRTRIYLPAKLWDNPDPEFVRRYEEDLQAQPTHKKQALLYGDWFVTAGSFYGDVWRQDIHVVKPYKIPQYWKQFRSMDWGFKQPGYIGWFALDDDGNLILYRELVFQGKTDEQVCEMIKFVEEKLGLWDRQRGSRITGPADTQLWERRGSSSLSMVEVFASNGVPWVQAEKTSGTRINGKTFLGRARNAQILYKRLGDHQRGTTHPGFVMFDTCTKAAEVLPSIQTDPHNMDLPMDGGYDHPHDAVLYACAYASRPEMVRAPDMKDEDDEPVATRQSRGRLGYGLY